MNQVLEKNKKFKLLVNIVYAILIAISVVSLIASFIAGILLRYLLFEMISALFGSIVFILIITILRLWIINSYSYYSIHKYKLLTEHGKQDERNTRVVKASNENKSNVIISKPEYPKSGVEYYANNIEKNNAEHIDGIEFSYLQNSKEISNFENKPTFKFLKFTSGKKYQRDFERGIVSFICFVKPILGSTIDVNKPIYFDLVISNGEDYSIIDRNIFEGQWDLKSKSSDSKNNLYCNAELHIQNRVFKYRRPYRIMILSIENNGFKYNVEEIFNVRY